MSMMDKDSSADHEKQQVTMLEEVALAGHVATDDQGRSLLVRDEAAEVSLPITLILLVHV